MVAQVSHSRVIGVANNPSKPSQVGPGDWDTAHTLVNVGNDVAAGVLVNATAAGDAGGRADHFEGTSLAGDWVTNGTIDFGPTVKYSAVSIRRTTGGAAILVRPFTPSGAFRFEAKFRFRANGGTGCGIIVLDAANVAGNGALVWINNTSPGRVETYILTGGSFGSPSAISVDDTWSDTAWKYLAIERNGSNQFTFYVSLDRVIWQPIDVNKAKTMTAAYFGFYIGVAHFTGEFIDVVS